MDSEELDCMENNINALFEYKAEHSLAIEHIMDELNRLNGNRYVPDELWPRFEEIVAPLKTGMDLINNRMLRLEEMYRSIDPKYLAMGNELSQANRDMISSNIDFKNWVAKELSKLGEAIRKLEGRDKSCT